MTNRYDDWFDRKDKAEKEQIEIEIRNRDWNSLNEYEKGKIYESEE